MPVAKSGEEGGPTGVSAPPMCSDRSVCATGWRGDYGKGGRGGVGPPGRSASLCSASCSTGRRPVVGIHTAGLVDFLGAMATRCGTSLLGIRAGGLGGLRVMDLRGEYSETCGRADGGVGRGGVETLVGRTAGSETLAELGRRGRRGELWSRRSGDLRSGGRRGRRPSPNWGWGRRRGTLVGGTAGSETLAERWFGGTAGSERLRRTPGSEGIEFAEGEWNVGAIRERFRALSIRLGRIMLLFLTPGI